MDLQKIHLAIESLKEGKIFNVFGLSLGILNNNAIYITGWSQYQIENLTKRMAIRELREIKDVFLKMLELSNELEHFVSDKKIKYNLAFNYGMGSIGVCSETDNVIQWEANLKD